MSIRKIYLYHPSLKENARKLRNNSTLSEILLWEELKGKKMQGYDFHRQKPIIRYIVDFFCHEPELAIEIDGDSHDFEEVYTKDLARQKEIEKLGIRLLRFDDKEVKKDMENVLREIKGYIEKYESSHKTNS